MIILSQFWQLLKQVVAFEAALVVVKISLKLIYNNYLTKLSFPN